MQALQPLPAPTNTANTAPAMTTSGGQPPLPVSETVWITTITRTDHDRPCARCASHALPHHHSPINSPPSSSTPVLAEPDDRTMADHGRSNVIKTSRSHRCHATMEIVIRFNGILDPWLHRRIDSLPPREDGTIVRYSAGSTEDLGGSTPSRCGSIAIEARGPTRGSSSAIVVLLEFAP